MSKINFWSLVCLLFAVAHYLAGNAQATATFCAALFVIAALRKSA